MKPLIDKVLHFLLSKLLENHGNKLKHTFSVVRYLTQTCRASLELTRRRNRLFAVHNQTGSVYCSVHTHSTIIRSELGLLLYIIHLLRTVVAQVVE